MYDTALASVNIVPPCSYDLPNGQVPAEGTEADVA